MTGREGIPPASSGAEGEDLSEQGGIPSRSYSPPTLCGDFASRHDAPHQAEVIRDMYYRYDPNGNVTEERQGVNTGANLQFSTGMELQVHGLKEVNDSHFHPVLHPV